MSRLRLSSTILLWLLGPALLWLSCNRNLAQGEPRAPRVPQRFAGFTLAKEHDTGPRIFQLLGTRDVTWRDYRAPDGGLVHLTAVFHDANWKSLHPPQICIRGSGFGIDEDQVLAWGEGSYGRILATDQRSGGRYLSFYAFVAADLCTGSYAEFFAHHAPRALFRRATSGFLLRVETSLGTGGLAAAEARCRSCLEAFLPIGRELIRR